ncbi:hypothetical protein [Chryseobacterium indoltheticum]
MDNQQNNPNDPPGSIEPLKSFDPTPSMSQSLQQDPAAPADFDGS